MTADCDVAVVGAGPVGSAAAYAFGRRGARVLLLEANPEACSRFAGEWLHPPGVEILERLGLTPLESLSSEAARGGFVVVPEGAGQAIRLPYGDGERALTCEHRALVGELRRRARGEPTVEYLSSARVTGLEEGQVHFNDTGTGKQLSASAGLIVGADGHSSVTHRYIGSAARRAQISFMGAVTLQDVELPHEGYAHVLVGGPGPVLMYRIGDGRVRLAFDVPSAARHLRGDGEAMLDAFSPVLLEPIRRALEEALREQRIRWAATYFRPRTSYGRGRIVAVGDAVGAFHPMTAAGMTMGLQDVACLAERETPEAYRRRRSAESYVPELLSNALYRVFVDGGRVARALRSAVYRAWRSEPAERTRTIRLLAGAETRGEQFAASFARIGARATADLVSSAVRDREPGSLPRSVTGLRDWARWPLAGLLPRVLRRSVRPRSTRHDPLGTGSVMKPGGAQVVTKRLSEKLTRLLSGGLATDSPDRSSRRLH